MNKAVRDAQGASGTGQPARQEGTNGALEVAAILDAALDCIIIMDHHGKIRASTRPRRQHSVSPQRMPSGRELADIVIPSPLP